MVQVAGSAGAKIQELNEALKTKDFKKAFEISSKLLKKDPSNQEWIKINIYSCKYDKKNYYDVIRFKDVVRFPKPLAEDLDCEALLMMMDIIEGVESTLASVQYAVPFIADVGEVSPYYAELLLTTLGVKFAELNDFDTSMKYHDLAIKRSSTGFISHYNRAMGLMRFGRFAEAIPDYEYRWKWPDFPSQQRLFGFPKADLSDPQTKNARMLVWAEQGVGDHLLWSQAVRILVDEGWTNITLEVHPKMQKLIQAGFPEIEVISQPVVRDAFDSSHDVSFNFNFDFHIPLVEVYMHVHKDIENFRTHAPYVNVDSTPAREFRRVILENQPGKVIIGVSLGSQLWDPFRGKLYLSKDDLLPLKELNDRAVFICFDYSLSVEQVEILRNETGLNLMAIRGVDQKNDLYTTTQMMQACDGFVGVSTAPTWQAAYSGLPTLVLWFTSLPGNAPQFFPKWVSSMNVFVSGYDQKTELMNTIVNNFDGLCAWFKNIRSPLS